MSERAGTSAQSVFSFEFVVAGMGREQVQELMDLINWLVERRGGTVLGGFAPWQPAVDGKDQSLNSNPV